MTKANYPFVLTGPKKRALETLGYDLTCEVCGRNIEVGQEVFSKTRGHGGTSSRQHNHHRRYYHKACWDACFREVT